ncbi:hypothetical protein GF337_16830 [candidate division KSB1 bacterium]|nr:hypothetical protein [candidate division KSB1 bacterium]
MKPFKSNVVPGKLKHAEGNIVIWLGDGNYPHELPEGFTVMTGDEGRQFWERAKKDWIKRHPKVARLENDPV